jgi:hypothetical protein
METLVWVEDSKHNLITHATKRFTMSPNPIVQIECTTFEAFTTTKTI